MKCSICETEFVLTPDKPGKINHCFDCSEDVPKLMAKVAWSGKHFMEMEITSNRADAIAFNRAGARRGHFPNLKFSSKESVVGRESSKRGSGSCIGDTYYSKVGERHFV
jgi:hypothetical protein